MPSASEESKLQPIGRQCTGIEAWVPRDGDAVLTKERFVFYVIGYLHPPEKVMAYVKYVPKKLSREFSIQWLPYEWKLAETVLLRPAKLYTPENYTRITEVFQKNHPEYIMRDLRLKRSLLTVPKASIKEVFEPSAGLMRLLEKGRKGDMDDLEGVAVNLTRCLSERTKVPLSSFGIHGSISLGMHNPQSDIDIAIYGASNFRRVLHLMNALSSKGSKLSLLEESIYDSLRRNRFLWNGKRVVLNAIRTLEEMREKFGEFNYIATGRHVSFMCRVTKAWESVFRPAIYGISEYRSLDQQSGLSREIIPSEVVSMIGEFRGIASQGDEIKVSGSLEKVEQSKTGKVHHCRVVVGSGELKPQDEFISVVSHPRS